MADKNYSNNTSMFYSHHVGGREGSVSFPILPQFTKDIVNIIYDADESCLA